MTRLRDLEIPWEQLMQISRHYGLKLQYRKARCEHGKTNDQNCRDCSNGYVQDTSYYAHLPAVAMLDDGRALVAVSDDTADVAFISKAQMDALDRP